MDRPRGGNVDPMDRSYARFSVLLALLAATGCVASKSSLDDGANLNAGSSDDTAGTTDGPGQSSTVGMTSTSGPDTATGAMTTGANPTTNDDDQDEETAEGVALDVATGLGECELIDHPSCYPAVLDACGPSSGWELDETCMAAILQCYPMGTPLLSPTTIVDTCASEIDGECLATDAPGCSEQLCNCTLGGYPFDWENCFHLAQVGCADGDSSECTAVLEACYPGATFEELQACYEEVTTVNTECECITCDQGEQCELALGECLAV